MEYPLHGLRIVPHVLALNVKTTHEVVRASEKKKRRKNWRVVKRTVTSPGAYVSGGVVYMHPDLISRLPKG